VFIHYWYVTQHQNRAVRASGVAVEPAFGVAAPETA
jgi:hypothetical protein